MTIEQLQDRLTHLQRTEKELENAKRDFEVQIANTTSEKAEKLKQQLQGNKNLIASNIKEQVEVTDTLEEKQKAN